MRDAMRLPGRMRANSTPRPALDASSEAPPTDTITRTVKVSHAEKNRNRRRSTKMRYRYLLVSLAGLLVGCQHCPLQCLKSGTPDINDPGAGAAITSGEIARPAPLPLGQPTPQAMSVTP